MLCQRGRRVAGRGRCGRVVTVEARAHVAWQLRDQGLSCAAMGSPLYAGLLERAAADVESGGPCWSVLSADVRPGRGDAMALRFLAAVHRLVLTGRAPVLAAHYPSAGGLAGAEAWTAFRAVVADHADELRALTLLPCQTNEVGRCAPLAVGFLRVAARTGLPLRLLEVGASAGLNLRWDLFRYGCDRAPEAGVSWGDPASPVDLTGLWRDAPAELPERVVVQERSGCDLRPVDPTTEDGRLALTASVWADQVVRFERLRGALQLAGAVPVRVDQASLESWLPPRLAERPPGTAAVVFHSVVDEYLPAAVRERFHETLREAGNRATTDAPLFWLRLEPLGSVREHGLTVTGWPGGEETLLARSGAHGTDVTRA
jgi:hypothetical protein